MAESKQELRNCLTLFANEVIEATLPNVDHSCQISKDEYAERWRKLQSEMKMKGYDLAYACGSELDRSDVAWLASVFDPIIERYGILVPREGVPVVLAGSEGGHVIKEAVLRSGAEMATLREYQISDEEYRHAHFVPLTEVIDKLTSVPVRKIAIMSNPEFLPCSHLEMFEKTLGADVEIIFDAETLALLKYEKSDKELEIIQHANIIADAAFRVMLAAVVPGMRELEVTALGDYVMKSLGAARMGFPTIATAGKRGFTLIGPAANNVIEEGDIVSLGLSPTFNGYHGIIRRTVKAGSEPLTEAETAFICAVEGLYKTVMDATIQAAREGLPSNFIDSAGKAYLDTVKLKTNTGEMVTPLEPYTFLHNTGCSECQEGYGAVTPHTERPLGSEVVLMIDVALSGFDKNGAKQFAVPYAVVEEVLWKKGTEVGIYNQLPINVQHLVGCCKLGGEGINPYHRPVESVFE